MATFVQKGQNGDQKKDVWKSEAQHVLEATAWEKPPAAAFYKAKPREAILKGQEKKGLSRFAALQNSWCSTWSKLFSFMLTHHAITLEIVDVIPMKRIEVVQFFKFFTVL